MTRRAVTGARSSSQLQRDASITDLHELRCRFVRQNGLEIAADYEWHRRNFASWCGSGASHVSGLFAWRMTAGPDVIRGSGSNEHSGL